MATISKRKTSTGETRYRVQIRIKRGGEIVHAESRTFSKLAVARAWAKDREVQLADPAELAKVAHVGVSVGQLISRYIEEVSPLRAFGRTKDASLLALCEEGIAQRNALTLTTRQILQHLTERRQGGAGPATVQQDLAWLRVVLRYARRVWQVPIDTTVVDDAAETAKEHRITARPRRRIRRPTADELTRITRYFQGRRRGIPMDLVLWLAIYSGRRQAELFRIRQADLHPDSGTYLVRDLKHPDGSAGNDKMATLPPAGWAMIEAIQKRVGEDELLLPFNPRTASSAWTRACKVLDIKDLRFHDLRHEACSRLAEDGATIPEIQQVSLHDSWSSLQRYVQVTRGDRIDWVELKA